MRLTSHVAVAVCTPAVVAPIGPLAWELPYATGAALKSMKKKKAKLSNPLNLVHFFLLRITYLQTSILLIILQDQKLTCYLGFVLFVCFCF